MVAKKSTDWLPAGWSVEFKVQKNGRKTEYYTNSETGQKFYSKNDVIRYLNMGSIHFNPPQLMDSQLSNPPQPVDGQLRNRSKKEQNQIVVKANSFPEWLPEGWIMELKIRKNGSKIGKEYKCYVDPSTGRKFYSKPEVFQYLKSAKRDSYSLKQKELGTGVLSKEDNVVEAKESPEWLPKGWTVELKTRKVGQQLGREYKCYIDSSTGHKFYSKPEVLRHLQSVKPDSCSSKPEDLGIGEHSTEKVVERANKSPEWLPKGWIIELKTHKSGSKIGKKFKYYVDPSTGRKFLSKPKVFQYLGSAKSDSCTFKHQDLGADVHSTEILQTDHSAESGDTPKQNVTGHVKDMKQNLSSCKQKKTHVGMPARNVSAEKVAPEGLPPGWILEIKTKGKRRDPYYTDPVSGYVFRSRKDVFRYLETGEVSRHAFKPKNMSINDSKTITNGIKPSSAAKMPELSDRATRRQLFAGNGNSELSSLAVPKPNAEGSLISRVTRASSKTKLPNAEGTNISRVTRASSKTKLPNAEGTNISRVTRASSKTRLVAAPMTESIEEKHPVEHSTAGKGSSEVSNLALSSAKGTSIRRVTRASAKTRLVAVPTTESLQEKLTWKHTTAGKGPSEVSNLALPNNEGTSLRRVTRGSAKKLLVSAPTNECLQKKHPLENIASDKESSEMSSVGLPNTEGSIIRRVTRGSTKAKLDSVSPEAKYLKRKRGKSVDDKTKHVSTPTADILQQKELMEYTIGKCAEAKENPYPAKGSKREQGKKGSAENGSVPVPIADMLEEGKLSKNVVEKNINQRAQKRLSKVKNQKEVNMNRRSSKRLAGIGSDLVENLQAPQGSAARDNSEDILALNMVVDNVAQWASQQLVTDPKFAHEASASPGNILNEEPSYKRNMFLEDQSDPKEHVGTLESGKKDEGNPEFAHKASVGPGNLEEPSYKSNMLSENQTDPKEHVGYLGSGKKVEGSPEFAHKASVGTGDALDENPSNKSNMLPEDQTDLKERVGCSEAEKNDEGNPEPQPRFAFDSWPDPCLEFAFKTLTGALPIEDNQDIHGYFQQKTDTSHIQRDGALGVSELGVPNTFETNGLSDCDAPVIPVSGAPPIENDIQGYFQQQSDTPDIQMNHGLGVPELGLHNTFETVGVVHFDAPVIPVSGQQLLVNPSFMSSSNVSLPSCNEISPQQPSLEENNNNHTQAHENHD